MSFGWFFVKFSSSSSLCACQFSTVDQLSLTMKKRQFFHSKLTLDTNVNDEKYPPKTPNQHQYFSVELTQKIVSNSSVWAHTTPIIGFVCLIDMKNLFKLSLDIPCWFDFLSLVNLLCILKIKQNLRWIRRQFESTQV